MDFRSNHDGFPISDDVPFLSLCSPVVDVFDLKSKGACKTYVAFQKYSYDKEAAAPHVGARGFFCACETLESDRAYVSQSRRPGQPRFTASLKPITKALLVRNRPGSPAGFGYLVDGLLRLGRSGNSGRTGLAACHGRTTSARSRVARRTESLRSPEPGDRSLYRRAQRPRMGQVDCPFSGVAYSERSQGINSRTVAGRAYASHNRTVAGTSVLQFQCAGAPQEGGRL